MATFKTFFWEFTLIVGAFFTPAWSILLSVFIAVMLDTLFGWIKASRKGISSSKGAREGFVPKMIGYVLLILCVFIIDSLFINEMVVSLNFMQYATTKLVSAVLIWIELVSVNENFREIKGKGFDVYFTQMVRSIKKVIASFTNKKQE